MFTLEIIRLQNFCLEVEHIAKTKRFENDIMFLDFWETFLIKIVNYLPANVFVLRCLCELMLIRIYCCLISVVVCADYRWSVKAYIQRKITRNDPIFCTLHTGNVKFA